MRSQGYWKSYHASKANEKRQVFRLCRRVVRKLGSPWQVAKRGRPPEHQPEEYAEIAIYRKHFHMSLRVAEGDTPLILGKRVDHSDIWWSLQRISPCYLNQSIELFFDLISELFSPDLFIADATGVTTDRYVRKRGPRLRPRGKPPPKWRKRREKRHSEDRVLVTLKLHILIGYNIELGLLMVRSALITKGSAHDSPRLKRLLKGVRGNGKPLLLDTGYDSENNYKLCKKHWFGPVIKLREGKPKGLIRREMAKVFADNKEIYRLRGLVEAVFGGLETKYGNRTRCRRTNSRRDDCLLMVVSHNLRTYMRAVALRELGFFVFLRIYWTTSPCPLCPTSTCGAQMALST